LFRQEEAAEAAVSIRNTAVTVVCARQSRADDAPNIWWGVCSRRNPRAGSIRSHVQRSIVAMDGSGSMTRARESRRIMTRARLWRDGGRGARGLENARDEAPSDGGRRRARRVVRGAARGPKIFCVFLRIAHCNRVFAWYICIARSGEADTEVAEAALPSSTTLLREQTHSPV